MRVVRNSFLELKYIDKRHIVSPDNAAFVFGSGDTYRPVEGLESMRRSINARSDDDIREALRRGDWLLIDAHLPDMGFASSIRSAPPAPLAPQPPTFAQEPWPQKQAQGVIFAKSCAPGRWGCAETGTEIEPAEHFGSLMIAKSKPIPAEAAPLMALIGADMVLGRIAGGGIQQRGYTWVLRGLLSASGPVAVFIAGMLPTKLGDGTLYSDDELRAMNAAASRVRFQFRRDPEGQLQLYGIHTGATGDDSVPTVRAQWTDQRRTLQADLGDGISILWTPNNGPLKTPELVYPQPGDERLGSIMVHPIAPDTDSQIEVYPEIDDVTLGDRIITFPADSGLSSLYVVYSKPLLAGHSYHTSPKELAAFPDARRVKSKSGVQGGGARRDRWVDSRGRIYEWDRQHGAVEIYTKQGKHLGEFDAETGKQTKPANPSRTTPK